MKQNEALLVYAIRRATRLNPLRLRYELTRADRARAAATLKDYLLTQRLLRFAQH